MHKTVCLFFAIVLKVDLVRADTYTVKIGADRHVNLIDKRFLSFTIDPKYLFSTSGKYDSKECICMASSLTPAYIRIAGPSTALMSYQNSSISIDEDTEPFEPKRSRFQTFFSENLAKMDEALQKRPRSDREEERRLRRPRTEVKEGRFKRNHNRLEVSHSEWRQFIQWAKSTGFDLVFAVNNEEKMKSGMWDPNMALNILTVAEKANVGDIFWQLGYECTNQSIEEYLNDLETLRVITETFPQGRSGRWKVVGGDVTGCLHADSKSDFKDYVTLSSDMMDAILLNGNSSTVELERMSDRDRLKLLRLLSHSSTPLWLSERRGGGGGGGRGGGRGGGGGVDSEMARAADWLTDLGHAARNGFSVHYRELDEEEMYQPTLSFYMALLFKNLVGERVLHLSMQPDQAIMFAHCTSLRHKEVPGAVTLYGVNVDEEPARFSIKLEKREEGGDIMQFVIGHDKSGNIVVNGRPMYHEGDLKPVVKRVRPYKTLLINLPANSFGFWVLANTNIEACFADNKLNETENIDDAVSISKEPEIEDLISKRSIKKQDFEEYTNSADMSVDFGDENDVIDELRNENLKNSVNNIHNDLRTVKAMFKLNSKPDRRTKRQTGDVNPNSKIRKLIRHGLKNRNVKSEPEQKPRRLLNNLLQTTKHNITKLLKSDRLPILRKLPIFSKNKLAKRQSDSTPKKTLIKRNDKNIVPKAIRHKEKSPQQNEINKEDFYKLEKNDAEVNDLKTKVSQRLVKLTKQNKNTNEGLTQVTKENIEEKLRTRRNTNDQVDLSVENEIDDELENVKLWKMLRKIHKQFKDLSEENDEYVDDIDTAADDSEVTHTERVKDDDLGVDTTFIKSTVYNLLRVISDLNKNLNRFWNGIKLLD